MPGEGVAIDLSVPERVRGHLGQAKVLEMGHPIVAVICGAQAGKTTVGPIWLEQRIAEGGAGEYVVGSPSYDLLDTKLLPEYEKHFVELRRGGRANHGGAPKIVLSASYMAKLGHRGSATIYFRTMGKPEQWESFTAKAIHLDEPGMLSVPERTFEAVQRRLAIARSSGFGRLLLTTTPYGWNWFKRRVSDFATCPVWSDPSGCEMRESEDGGIGVLNFPSWLNPSFDKSIADEALRSGMMEWRWRMMYEGVFTRPAGAVYDCFDRSSCLFDLGSLKVDHRWKVHLGMDFGPINTAGVVVLECPLGMLYLAGAYHPGAHKTVAEHHYRLRQKVSDCAPGLALDRVVGGQRGESEWRAQFHDQGLPVEPPVVHEIDVQIGCVYRLFRTGFLKVASHLEGLIREFEEYQYELDEFGDPTGRVANESRFHRHAACRYVLSALRLTEAGLGRGSRLLDD
jgi:hypothetical protein